MAQRYVTLQIIHADFFLSIWAIWDTFVFLENSSLSSWIFIRINFTPNYRSHFVKNWAPSTSRESSNYFTPFAISCCYSWAFAGNLKEKNKFLSIFLNFGFERSFGMIIHIRSHESQWTLFLILHTLQLKSNTQNF